ncbi:hypothetical protein CAQU_07745 [Corynebacterium aquilae DSM 44791]|uniref:VTT domain-containing protein n=1 Tax=Corynebacterium aquilae DSM 44791 TaxID=1431546 RepID=A0A1L7CGJ6_9CORY|nr:hypothetical protein CAQU_07745 [Corynebacterium aquilae DSM 44791]
MHGDHAPTSADNEADSELLTSGIAPSAEDIDAVAETKNSEDTPSEEDKPWWDQPGMPWNKQPTKADLWCFGAFIAVGFISMALLPLRAYLLGDESRLPWAVALLGSSTGGAGLGALHKVGTEVPLLWPLLLGGLTRIKFDWIYWWAGALWGRGMIEMSAAQSPRAARNYARAEKWAHKMGWIGIFVAYVPIPLPIRLVVFVLAGAQGMNLKKFLLIDYLAATVWLAGYMYFGYSVGEPAVAVLEGYAKIANYVAIGLVVFIIAAAMMRNKKQAT